MNYFKARQRKDGKFDYTCMNDGQIWPVGYCSVYHELPNDNWISESYRAANEATKDKHHGDGHDTAQEAQACYRAYLLDHALHLNGAWENVQHKCEVCGEWTELYAEIQMRCWNLCPQHNSREEVEKLFEAPDEIWSS